MKSIKGFIEVYLCLEDIEGNGDISFFSLGSFNSEESRESLYVLDDFFFCDSFRCKYMYICMKFNWKKFLVEVKDDENISMVSVYILCIYLCI